MSLSKLTQAAAGAIKEVYGKKASDVGAKIAKKVQEAPKYTKSSLEALASQGKAMVKKFDNATNKAADSLNKMSKSKLKAEQQIEACLDNLKNTIPESTSQNIKANKWIIDSEGVKVVKSAQDSAEWMKAQFAFEGMIEPGLSHKSAKESAQVIMAGGDTPMVAAMRERVAKFDTPELKAKKAQMDLKRELKAKHADKLK